MPQLFCPMDGSPCNCHCCRVGGCMLDGSQVPADPLIECPKCELKVSPRDFLTTMCRDCAFDEHQAQQKGEPA